MADGRLVVGLGEVKPLDMDHSHSNRGSWSFLVGNGWAILDWPIPIAIVLEWLVFCVVRFSLVVGRWRQTCRTRDSVDNVLLDNSNDQGDTSLGVRTCLDMVTH